MTTITYSRTLSKRAKRASSQDALDFDGFDLVVAGPHGGLRNGKDAKVIS